MGAIVITGLPGTGKTRLALALGVAFEATGTPTLVLHTDLLKVTLRQIFPEDLKGPGYAPDYECKVAQVRPFLEAQVSKAQKDGYILILEGTLALGFFPTPGIHCLLELPEVLRQQRILAKPPTAQRSLAQISLEPYARALSAQSHPSLLSLNAQQPTTALVDHIKHHFLEAWQREVWGQGIINAVPKGNGDRMDRAKVVAVITGVLSLLLAVGYLLLVQLLDFRGEMLPAPIDILGKLPYSFW
jgi:hypothetical protein